MTEPTVTQRLLTAGVELAEAGALQLIWNSERLDPFLPYDAWELRLLGYDAADAWEMLRHDLTRQVVHLYFSHCLTAHQGATIEANDRARLNLRAGGDEAAEALLDAPVPRQFLIRSGAFPTRPLAASRLPPLRPRHGLDSAKRRTPLGGDNLWARRTKKKTTETPAWPEPSANPGSGQPAHRSARPIGTSTVWIAGAWRGIRTRDPS